MALPPLELFSLKKKPPCCRVASSLFRVQLLGDVGEEKFPEAEANEKKSTSIFTSIMKTGAMPPMQECKERHSSAPKELYVACAASCVADINRSFVTCPVDMAQAL